MQQILTLYNEYLLYTTSTYVAPDRSSQVISVWQGRDLRSVPVTYVGRLSVEIYILL